MSYRPRVIMLPEYHISDDFTAKYIADRNSIETVEDCIAHVRKWKHLWGYYPQDVHIFEGKWNPTVALRCIEQIRKSGQCSHVDKGVASKGCGVHIALPKALLITHFVVKMYKVPEFVALHQLFCTEKEHNFCF